MVKSFFIDRVLRFLFPLVCPACDQSIDHSSPSVCKRCHPLLEATQIDWQRGCERCSLPSCALDCNFSFCQQRRIFFDRHVSLYYLTDQRWKKIIKNWKFKNDRQIYQIFIERIVQLLPILGQWKLNRIIYIHSGNISKNRNLRTFQPCADLAKIFGKILDLEQHIGADLEKKPSFQGKKQSHQDYRDRFLAIHDSLQLNPASPKPNDKNYLIVEDIYTTGATANEAARILKLNHANKVYVVSALQALN